MSKTTRQVRNESNISQENVVKITSKKSDFAEKMSFLLEDILQMWVHNKEFSCTQTGLLFYYNKTKKDGSLNDPEKQVYDLEIFTYLDDGTPIYRVLDVFTSSEKFNKFYQYHAYEYDDVMLGTVKATMFCKDISGAVPYRFAEIDEHKKAIFELARQRANKK